MSWGKFIATVGLFGAYVTSYIFIDKHIDITSDRIHIVKKIAPKPQMD